MAINGAKAPERPLTQAEIARRAEALALRAAIQVRECAAEAAARDEIPPATERPRDEPEPDARLPRVIRDGVPVDQWVASEGGLRRWRAIIDDFRVVPLPHGGVLIEIGGARAIRLDAALRAHLAMLLLPEEWRAALAAAGAL